MKVGDRVKVIKVVEVDQDESNLSIGMTGIITDAGFYNSDNGSDSDVFTVEFDDDSGFICSEYSDNLSPYGYDMCAEQLELIEDET